MEKSKIKTEKTPYVCGVVDEEVLSQFRSPTKEEAENILDYYRYNSGRDSKISIVFGAIALVVGILFVLVALCSWNPNAEFARVLVAALGVGMLSASIALFKWHNSENKRIVLVQNQNHVVSAGHITNVRYPHAFTAPGTAEIRVSTESGATIDAWFLVRRKGAKNGTPVVLSYIVFGEKDVDFRAFTPYMFTKQGMRELLDDSPMNQAV